MIRTILYGIAGGFAAMVAVLLVLHNFAPDTNLDTSIRWVVQSGLAGMFVVMVAHLIYRYRKRK